MYYRIGIVIVLMTGGILLGLSWMDAETGSEAISENVSTSERSLYKGHTFEELNSEVVSGGVPKDGIPSVDEPKFTSADEVEMDEGEIVFGVARNGTVRAYPQRILVSHEIVNDEISGEKVTVSYCPLTASAMGHKSGVEMGVSGDLLNSNLVMYDRDTESYWPQIMSTAIKGEKQGRSLDEFRVVWTTWSEWKEKHPHTEVLTEDTGHLRNYDSDPYGEYNPRSGYYESQTVMFPLMAENTSRHPKEMVLGYRNSEGAAAFDYDLLREEKVIDAEIGSKNHVMVYEEVLDTGRLYRNPEEIEVKVSEDGKYLVDGETYSADNLPLEEKPVFDVFWFAWNSFYPEAKIYG
jgi:hypothetical protein